MSFLEDIGDAAINLINRAVYLILGAVIKVLKLSGPVYERATGLSFYSPFEKRGVEYRDYVILKAQVATLAFLVLVVSYIFNLLSGTLVAIAMVISGIASLMLINTQIREYFQEDFRAYRDFFLSYLIISLLLIMVKLWKPTINYVFPFAHLFVFSVVSIGIFSFWFKNRYGRNYTVGHVLDGGPRMVVKVNYDLRASVKPGTYEFDNVTGAKEGDLVKLRVEEGSMNLRGKKPMGVYRGNGRRTAT